MFVFHIYYSIILYSIVILLIHHVFVRRLFGRLNSDSRGVLKVRAHVLHGGTQCNRLIIVIYALLVNRSRPRMEEVPRRIRFSELGGGHVLDHSNWHCADWLGYGRDLVAKELGAQRRVLEWCFFVARGVLGAAVWGSKRIGSSSRQPKRTK